MNNLCFLCLCLIASLNFHLLILCHPSHLKFSVLGHEYGLIEFLFDFLDDNGCNWFVSDSPHHHKEALCKKMSCNCLDLDHCREVNDYDHKLLTSLHANGFPYAEQSTWRCWSPALRHRQSALQQVLLQITCGWFGQLLSKSWRWPGTKWWIGCPRLRWFPNDGIQKTFFQWVLCEKNKWRRSWFQIQSNQWPDERHLKWRQWSLRCIHQQTLRR